MIKIYDINDKLLMQAEVTSAAKREQEMSKSDYISLSFSAAEKVILPVGAYINYTYKIDKVREVTRKFLLLESYEPTQSDECSWKYTPQFQHPKMILSKTPFFIYTRNSQNVEVKQYVWSFVGTTSALSEKIKDFLNKDLMFGECGWKVIFSNVTANTVNVSFSDNDFISALTAITNAIGDNCEWHIDYDDEIIYIGKVLVGAIPVVLEVGKNVGVPNISNSKESYYNAFSIFGGTRNITQVNSKGENVSSGDIRLQLDEGNGTILIDGKERSYSIDKYSTLDLRANKTKEPLFTKVLDFSQIYPSLNTYVYNVRGRVKYVLDENNEKIPISYNADGSVKEYKTFTVWYMRLAYPTTEKVEGKTIINTTVDDGVTHYWYDFQITDDLLINGKNIGCSFEPNFNTGALSTPLAGRGSNGEYVGFELTYHKEASSSHTSDDVSDGNFSVLAGDYEIIYQEDNEVIIPTNEAEMLIPRGERKPSLKCNITVLYNIAMADTIYYEDAQNRLLEKAKEEIIRLLSDMNNYEVKSYSDVFLEDNPQLQIGQSVKYKDGHGYELATRVLKLSTNIDYDFIQSITIGNQVIKGTITQLKEDVQTIIASGGSSGNGGGYSVSQLRNLIAKYGSDNFISKQFDDIASGTITFQKVQNFLHGMDIGDHAGQWTRDGVLSVFKFLTNNFDQGLYGHGAQIDEHGNIEANSIFARQFISAPKFVFNEISVTKAEQWNTNGYGTIKSVDVTNHIITMKLEENDYGSLFVGDICRGIFADIDNTYESDTNSEGELDDCNFVLHKGFFTTYFYVKRIITSEKGKFVFEYGKRSEKTPDPCSYMDFAQYGSFTDEQRQSSMYFCSRGRSYIEVLDGVNNWEIYPQNRVCRYGWLGGLAIKRRDGSYIHPSGNGIFVQDNVYFGGNVEYLGDILGLDDLKNEAKAYDVSLSQYQSVVTVDDMGNVINGLYTQDEGKATKQYRISTAVFVRKGMDILLEEDAHSENVTNGHYRLHVISDDCDVEVKNSTVFVKGIRNIKDGVAGTADDTNFDYAAMRKMSDAMVTIVVELEGKTSKTVQMPIRIQHESLPFMVCDLSNESASVAWNTRAGKYIGFPIKTKVSLMYHNEPWAISSLNISNVSGLKTSMSIEGKAKVITIDADNLTADTLAQITKMNITVVGKYAGASYEYTRELTILKSSDTVVYEMIPSADSVIIDNQGNMSVQSISCNVWATSSDDKRYKLTELPAGYHLKHGTSDTPDTDMEIGAEVSVQSDARQVVFALYDASGNVLDKESVPVLTCGADGDGYEYIYYLSDQSESNSITRPYRQNGVLQPMGWQDDPMEPTLEKQYVYVAYKTGEVGSDGSFSEPKLFNRYPKSISRIETWYYAAGSSDINPSPSLFRDYGSQDFSEITLNDATPWLWIMKITWFTDGDEVINISCGGYKAKDGQDGDGLIVGYQSSASEPSVLPTPKTLAEYDKSQDDIGHGWTKTAPATGGKSIVLGGKITTDEIIDRYNSSTSAWGTEESEILLDGIKQKKTFYKTPSSLGDNGKCIRRIKVVNHFRDSYIRVMLKSYSEVNYDLVCISRLYLPSEVINSEGNQIKEDSEYLNRSEHAYVVSGDGQSLVAELSMPDAGEYYFFIGYFKDGSTDSYGDYGLFAWQSMIALTESLWRTDGTVDAVGNITWSKAMPMQAEAIVMERAYIATTNDTEAPAKPYRINGILQGGWTAKRLAVSSVNRFIWESVRAGKHGTDSVQDDWSQPVIVANFAEAGKMGKNGCIVRNSEGWKSGATYHNDSALTLKQKYIDLIYIEDSNANDGWSVYQCNVTHTATGSSFDPSATDSDGNRLWVKLSDAGPMYSPLIVGKNAVLKFAQGQQFNLMEGNNIFGSFRWVKNNADYAFWIGGTSGDVATTSITRGGKLKTTDADITGKITANSGKIGGLDITENGLGIGVYGQFDLLIGTALEHSSLWNGYYNNGYGEVCVGKAALINPFTDYWQTACDMYGDRASGQTGSSNVNNATMIVRKITKGSNMGSSVSAVNNVFDPAYAALNVDTDEGIGIRSIGGNLLGCIAQNVIRTDYVTEKEQTAIDNNRVGIIVMVNSNYTDIKLPKNPMKGQMLIVVQGNNRIYFDPVVSGRKLYCCGKIHTTSEKFYSDDVGQFNILIWDGYNWQLQYIFH